MSEMIEQSKAEVTIIDEPRALAPLTPMAMIDRALASGAGVETLDKLMALQERYEALQARKAFDNAMADLREELRTVIKTNVVIKSDGGVMYKYESLTDVTEMIDPLLPRHGLSYGWARKKVDGEMCIVCIVKHRDGHREETSLPFSPDGGQNRNAHQALGSGVAYLERYTLKMAFGIGAGQKDDDAQSLSESSTYDTSPWTERIMNATHDGALNSIAADLKAATDIPSAAMRALRAAWAGRKKQLATGRADHAEG